ncbi:MAG: hypothetical protein AB1546_02860 [bacterium]
MNRKEIAIFITLMILFIYYQRPPLHANRYLCLTYSIVNRGVMNIDHCHKRTGDKSFYEGHYYLAANPGLSFLAAPVYAVVRLITPEFIRSSETISHFIINVIVNDILVCLMMVMFYRVLGYFGMKNGRWKILITLTAGLGTIIFSYSLEYFAESTVGAFFAFAGFYLLLYPGDKPDYYAPPFFRLFASGLCCGMCLLIGYSYFFFAVIFALYLLMRVRSVRIFIFGFGFVLMLIVLLLYQKACFGGYLTSYNYYMANEAFVEHFRAGFMGFRSFSLHNLREYLIGMRHGFFTFMPAMILSLTGLTIYLRMVQRNNFASVLPILPDRAKREVIFITVMFLIYLSAFSSYPLWASGSSFGPRYLVVTIPFFFLLSSFAVESAPAWFVVFFCVISFLINWFGAQFTYTLDKNLFSYISLFARNGPSSPFTYYLVNNMGLPESLVRARTVAALNVFLISLTGIFLWWLWCRYANLILVQKVQGARRKAH